MSTKKADTVLNQTELIQLFPNGNFTQIRSLLELNQLEPDKYPFTSSAQFEGVVSDWFYGQLPLGLFVLPEATLVGSRGLTFLPDWVLLREQNYGFLTREHLVEALTKVPAGVNPDAVEKVTNAVSLISPCCYCFYHWMLDCLPKIALAEACGFDGMYLVPNSRANPWVAETVNMLGIPSTRIHELRSGYIQIEKLVVPTYFSSAHADTCAVVLELYRSKMLSALPHLAPPGHERLFVPRRLPALSRRLTNQEQVSEMLAKYGFSEIYMEELSVAEQINISRSTQILVGPHGSGLVHSLFMPAGSTVVELFGDSKTNPCFEVFTGIMGHRHIQLYNKTAPQNDICVNLEQLESSLSEQFGPQAGAIPA